MIGSFNLQNFFRFCSYFCRCTQDEAENSSSERTYAYADGCLDPSCPSCSTGGRADYDGGRKLFACWAIVLVLLAMAVVFMRAGKREYAVGILPLILPPAVHIVSGVIARFPGSAAAA